MPDTSPEFFEAMYRASADPWNFAASAFEQSRYDAMFAALNGRHFGAAFEPACALGDFTLRLAACCDTVRALDASPTAAARARLRCAPQAHVHVTRGVLPQDMPAARFDLIVLAECGYYFDALALDALTTTLCQHMTPGGTLLACHWLGHSPDHRLHGYQVHEVLEQAGHWAPGSSASTRASSYLVQTWRSPS